MSNIEAFLLILTLWLLTGRGLNLCFVIISYYLMYIACPLFSDGSIVTTTRPEAVATYAAQLSFDVLALMLTLAISVIYQKNIKISLVYGAIIATSALLNAAMMLGMVVHEESLYWLHSLRQNIAIPLDLLFAVAGSAKGGQIFDYISCRLLDSSRSVYNRLNRISNHL